MGRLPLLKQAECVLCDVVINRENDSNEHIIPNAIGGKKVVRAFICRNCNSTSGHAWDTELVKQLHPLCVLLNIQRSRGVVPKLSVKSSKGRTLIVSADRHITVPTQFIEQRDGERTHIQINTSSTAELRKKIFEIARKYPQVDAEKVFQQAKVTSGYIDEPTYIKLSFGGERAGRSIVKSAMALISDAGMRVQDCELACQYLRSGGEACFGHYNENDFVKDRPLRTFFHCVYVQGDPRAKQVLAYAEYFGFQRIIMCLSNNYVGPRFAHSYAVDPVTGRELQLDVELLLSRQDMELAYAGKKVDYAVAKEAIAELIQHYQKTAYEREKLRVIEQAVEYAFENCGSKVGEELSEAQLNFLSGLIFEKMEPFLLRIIQGNRR